MIRKKKSASFILRAIAAISFAAVVALANGCGNPFRENNDVPPATSGVVKGIALVPSSQTLGRTASLSSEQAFAEATVTLWRMGDDGDMTQIAGAVAITDSEGAFELPNVPLNEANLVVQAQLTPSSTGIPVTMRAALPEITSDEPVVENFDVDTETTLSVEGLRLAVLVAAESDASGAKAAADIDHEAFQDFLDEIYDNLMDELNTQDTDISIAEVLTDAGALEAELIEFLATDDGLDDAYDALKPATSSVNTPGKESASSLSIALSADEDTADVYFTTDGSEPTTDSQIFSSNFTLSATTTLKFFAGDEDGNVEIVHTEQYYIHQ